MKKITEMSKRPTAAPLSAINTTVRLCTIEELSEKLENINFNEKENIDYIKKYLRELIAWRKYGYAIDEARQHKPV